MDSIALNLYIICGIIIIVFILTMLFGGADIILWLKAHYYNHELLHMVKKTENEFRSDERDIAGAKLNAVSDIIEYYLIKDKDFFEELPYVRYDEESHKVIIEKRKVKINPSEKDRT